MEKTYAFKKIEITDNEKIWLSTFYNKLKTFYYNDQDFNVLDVPIKDIINELKVELYGKLKDFDYKNIDGSLFRANHLTLIGLWYIDPESNIFDHVTKIISYIKELILSDKKPKEITINDIVIKTQLKEVDVQVALYLIHDIGNFWHGLIRLNNSNTGYLSIPIDNEYDAYLNFNDIEELMEKFYKSTLTNDVLRANQSSLLSNNDSQNIKKEIAIIIDGPNLINRILDLKINKESIVNQFSLLNLMRSINEQLSNLECPYLCSTIEFICSQRPFGKDDKFTNNEMKSLIDRFKKEEGVHVEIVNIQGNQEKGVDVKVVVELTKYAKKDGAAVLISADKDYVPVLEDLRKNDKKIITIAFNNNLPSEICNESHKVINLSKDYASFFIYNYPEYNINTLTLDDLKNMYANANDGEDNRLKVYPSGDIRITHGEDITINHDSESKFRMEIYHAYNGYVGPIAASNDDYMQDRYNILIKNWELGTTGLLDSY